MCRTYTCSTVDFIMEPNSTNVDLLTTDQLREKVERAWIQHIKLCQDNFLYFVKEMWPDFIFRKETDRTRWGHHQIIANEFTKIASNKKGRLITKARYNLNDYNFYGKI